jgi:hypothetical protein
VLTIQERWRFESIPNQLVIYSSHKPHSLTKWATDHKWHHFGNVAGQTGTAIPMDILTTRNQALPALGLTRRAPVIPPSAPIYEPNRSILARIVPLASRSKDTLFGQLNVRHSFNMTRGTSNDRSLIETDGNYQHPRTLSGCPKYLFHLVSNYPSTLGYFHDSIRS